MIWYKSSIQERSSPLGAKMGRWSPVYQQIREKIIEMFKNNVPQRKIGRDLDISPSTVHNIIKRFKESGGISVRKGQGRKPKLNNRDLRSLRRHCIKNRHSSISDITTWAQDYFGKPLSSTTIRSYIHKCQLKLYCAKRKPYVNSVQKRRRLLWARRHLGWTITQWKRVLWSDKSVFQVFFGRNGHRVLRTKEEKDHPDKTWNILCSYCLQWNTSQSKFRNHYFLFFICVFHTVPTFSDLGLYYNTNFSLEKTSKVQKVNQKYTFTHNLTTKCNFQTPSLFFYLNRHGMERTGLWDIKGSEGYIYAAFKNRSDEGISWDRKWS